MVLTFYRLREQPFGPTPSARFLFETLQQREALASLLYAVESRTGFSALVAPPGMGKTTLLLHAMGQLDAVARTAFVFQTQCTPREFFRFIAADLDIPIEDYDLVSLHSRFREVLLQEASVGKQVVIFIDEGQNLAPDVLEAVRLLSDYETPDHKLVHIVLSGQPQLEQTLAGIPELWQRIGIISHLGPLDREGTQGYIEKRLAVAGASENPFTPDAVRAIAQHSRGVPREINRLCFNALSLGCALQSREIHEAVIEQVAIEGHLGSALPARDETELTVPGPETVLEGRTQSDRTIKGDRRHNKILSEEPLRVAQVAGTSARSMPSANVGLRQSTLTLPSAHRPTPSVAPPMPSTRPIVSARSSVSQRAMAPQRTVTSSRRVTPHASVPTMRPVAFPQENTGWTDKVRNHLPAIIISIVLLCVMAAAFFAASQPTSRATNDTVQPAGDGIRTAGDADANGPGSSSADSDSAATTKSKTTKSKKEKAGASSKGRRKARRISDARVIAPETAAIPDGTAQAQSEAEPSEPPQVAISYTTNPSLEMPELTNTTLPSLAADAQPAGTPFGKDAGKNADLPTAKPPVVMPARLIHKVDPSYPAAARSLGIGGQVVLTGLVTANGTIEDISVVKGPVLLGRAAIDAVRQWVYAPATLNGKAVASQATITVDFQPSK